MRGTMPHDGQRRDRLLIGILRDEWTESRSPMSKRTVGSVTRCPDRREGERVTIRPAANCQGDGSIGTANRGGSGAAGPGCHRHDGRDPSSRVCLSLGGDRWGEGDCQL